MTDGDGVVVAGAVQSGHTSGGSHPVRRSVGELEIAGNQAVSHSVCHLNHSQGSDLADHASGDAVEEPAQVNVVADHLIPLNSNLAGSGSGVQGGGTGVQIVTGLGTGSTPRVILKGEDVVGSNIQFVSLTQGNIHSLSQITQSVAHGDGQDGSDDVPDDTSQNLQEGAVGHELLLILQEILIISGSNFAGDGASPGGGIQEQSLLGVPIHLGIALLSQHGGVLSGLLLQNTQGVCVTTIALHHQQTALSHDIGTVFLNAVELGGVGVKAIHVDGIELNAHSLIHSFLRLRKCKPERPRSQTRRMRPQ